MNWSHFVKSLLLNCFTNIPQAPRNIQNSTNNNTVTKRFYIGQTSRTFKERWGVHTNSFRNRNCKNPTELTKYIWSLEDKNIDLIISKQIMIYLEEFFNKNGKIQTRRRRRRFKNKTRQNR